MLAHLLILIRLVLRNALDLAPLIAVIAVFQLLVLQQPFPELGRMLVGLVLVLVGLTLFVQGLSLSLFPVGEGMADAFARRGNLWLLLAFAFAIGFGSTIAEPALLAVATQAATAAVTGGLLADDPAAIAQYAGGLRYTASASVGLAVTVGVFRIIKGWPIMWFVLGGHLIALCLVMGAPRPIVGIAYDAGASATSAINIPLIMALGVGLASVLSERNPLTDGFGMIAVASLMPVISILIYGML